MIHELNRTLIASPPDREKLVADLLTAGGQFGEVNQESAVPVVEIYPRRDGEPWRLECRALIDALNNALYRLGLDADGREVAE
jgi:hypothetical protein